MTGQNSFCSASLVVVMPGIVVAAAVVDSDGASTTTQSFETQHSPATMHYC